MQRHVSDRRNSRRAQPRVARQGRGGRARAGLPAGARALVGRRPAGPGQDDSGQGAGAGAGRQVRAGPVHSRSAAGRHHRVPRLRPAHPRVRVPARPRLRRRAPGRRDQSHHAAHPERTAGSDGRASGHGGQRPARPLRHVLRDRHPEPRRAARNLPAARGPARSVRDEAADRLPGPRARAGHARSGGRPGRGN